VVLLPRDGISAVHAVVRCPSVRLSVTFVYCVETSKRILKLFSSSGRSSLVNVCCVTLAKDAETKTIKLAYGHQKTGNSPIINEGTPEGPAVYDRKYLW